MVQRSLPEYVGGVLTSKGELGSWDNGVEEEEEEEEEEEIVVFNPLNITGEARHKIVDLYGENYRIFSQTDTSYYVDTNGDNEIDFIVSKEEIDNHVITAPVLFDVDNHDWEATVNHLFDHKDNNDWFNEITYEQLETIAEFGEKNGFIIEILAGSVAESFTVLYVDAYGKHHVITLNVIEEWLSFN